MFVARQWIRYRTANVNEYSGRFSEIPNEFYFPDLERFTHQSTENKQGSSVDMIENASYHRQVQRDYSDEDFRLYEESLEAGLNREIARIGLPISTYTIMYWKNDLHNLFHFLEQRLSKDAQPEIRVYAEAIAEIVRLWVPYAWEAFLDYRLNAVTFSRMEYEFLAEMIMTFQGRLTTVPVDREEDNFSKEDLIKGGMSAREAQNFLNKFDRQMIRIMK
jgi:thymidylate synthase (FAD)